MRGSLGRTVTLCLVAALLGAASAAALELGVETRVDNLGFRTDRTSADTSLPGGDFFWGVSLFGSQALSDSISVESGFFSDPVLRNVSRTLFTYNAGFLVVGLGPVFGLFNDLGTPLKSGLNAFVRLEYPGVIFLALRSDNSLGGALVHAGDYTQQRTDATLGAYFPNAICTLSFAARSFTQKAAAGDVTDSLTEYTFATEIYKKNVPYRLRVWMAYQDLSRSYATGSTVTSTLGSIILGTQLDVSLSGPFTLKVGLEGNVYSFGLGTLVGQKERAPGYGGSCRSMLSRVSTARASSRPSSAARGTEGPGCCQAA
jgi:hypothetical protein